MVKTKNTKIHPIYKTVLVVTSLILCGIVFTPKSYMLTLILFYLIFAKRHTFIVFKYWWHLIKMRKWKNIIHIIQEALTLKNGILILGLNILNNNIIFYETLNKLTGGEITTILSQELNVNVFNTSFTLFIILFIGVIQKTLQKLGYGDSGHW